MKDLLFKNQKIQQLLNLKFLHKQKDFDMNLS